MYFIIWCILGFIFIKTSNECFFQGGGLGCQCSYTCLESCQPYSEQTFYYAPQVQDSKCNQGPITSLPRPIQSKYFNKEPIYTNPQLISPSNKSYPIPQARVY
uniref:Secreted protein n=1 Tax=Strongyloides stercoralis TaxID=6248 RepID=A0A0K0EI75_STRER